jgi:hypothetical protein
MVQVYKAIVVEVPEGAGVSGDPVRTVHYIYKADDLSLIGRVDMWGEQERMQRAMAQAGRP